MFFSRTLFKVEINILFFVENLHYEVVNSSSLQAQFQQDQRFLDISTTFCIKEHMPLFSKIMFT